MPLTGGIGHDRKSAATTATENAVTRHKFAVGQVVEFLLMPAESRTPRSGETRLP